MAVINNNRPIARLLLRAGANPDRKMTGGDTPLHAAVRRGHVEMVAMLAAARPDFRRYDAEGRTALGLAATLAQYDIATILIKQGAPIEIGNKYAHSPLWLANAYNDPKMLRLLLKHGADPRDISLESLN
jgi:ankyrin repeat protein